MNDNNFPFSSGRTPGAPDNNEFIQIGLGRPLRLQPQQAIPEPGTLALLATAAMGGLSLPLRKRRKS